MSDIRTIKLPDVSPFVTLLGAVDDLAPACAETLGMLPPAEYFSRSATIELGLKLVVTEDDRSSTLYSSDPIPVNGWNLLTEGYFLSDGLLDFPPAVFLTGTACTPNVIRRDFLKRRAAGYGLFPRAGELRDVHDEMLAIIAPS